MSYFHPRPFERQHVVAVQCRTYFSGLISMLVLMFCKFLAA